MTQPPTHDSAQSLPFLHRVAIVIALTCVALAGVLMLWFQIRVLLLGFAGVLVAVFLYTIADFATREFHLPYWLSLTLTILLLLAATVGLFWLMGDRFSHQIDALKDQLPKAWNRLRSQMEQKPWGAWVFNQVEENSDALQSSSFVQSSLNFAKSTGQIVGETFVVLFIGIFAAISPQLYVRGILHLVPIPRRRRASEALQALGHLLWWWLVAQLASMVFIGVITFLVVWLLGVPLALTLGILAGLLNFIPNFGPILAVIPAALLALLKGPNTAIWIIVAYIAIQFLQNHLITPLLQQRAVQLPAVILMLSQIFMLYWAGLLGVTLAPALAAAVMKLIQMLYVHDVLQDPMPESTGFWLDSPGQT